MRKFVLLPLALVIVYVGFVFIHHDSASDSKAYAAKKSGTLASKKSPPPVSSPYVKGKALLSESSFQFGYAPTSTRVFHPFWIKNIGTDTLDIIKIKPG